MQSFNPISPSLRDKQLFRWQASSFPSPGDIHVVSLKFTSPSMLSQDHIAVLILQFGSDAWSLQKCIFSICFSNFSIDRLRDSRVDAKLTRNLEVAPKNVTFENLPAYRMRMSVYRHIFRGDLSLALVSV